jgi:hypothetical protein
MRLSDSSSIASFQKAEIPGSIPANSWREVTLRSCSGMGMWHQTKPTVLVKYSCTLGEVGPEIKIRVGCFSLDASNFAAFQLWQRAVALVASRPSVSAGFRRRCAHVRAPRT